MSATGRSDVRVEADFYQTPAGLARVAVNEIAGMWRSPAEAGAEPPRPLRVLDPGAGSGAITRELRHAFPEARITAVDLLEERRREEMLAAGADVVLEHDFIWPHEELDGAAPFDVVVANPPFIIARDFLRRALYLAGIMACEADVERPGSTVAFLLRLGFLGTIQRVGLFSEFPPVAMRTAVPRPSFRNGGVGTDATEYAWFFWGRPPPGRPIGWYRW